jgi:hypothetical protein
VTRKEVDGLSPDEVIPAFWWEYLNAASEANDPKRPHKALLVQVALRVDTTVQRKAHIAGSIAQGFADTDGWNSPPFISPIYDRWNIGSYRWRVLRLFAYGKDGKMLAGPDFLKNTPWLNLDAEVRRELTKRFPEVTRIWIEPERP